MRDHNSDAKNAQNTGETAVLGSEAARRAAIALQSSPELTENTARILADHPELFALVAAWPTLDSARQEAILNAAGIESDGR